MDTEAWNEWKRHLDKFQSRREDRIAHPDRTVTRWGKRARPQAAFADFIGLERGRVLDVGCGPGTFRRRLDAEHLEYYGLDPITLGGTEGFPFVHAIAERVPFADATFTDLLVLAALDHFRDIDAFAIEAARVLVPDGRLHVLQSVHDLSGPVSLVRMVGHRLKDSIEERVMDVREKDAPKHLSDFTAASLQASFAEHFDIVRSHAHNDRWYTPTKLFLTLRRRAVRARRAASVVAGRRRVAETLEERVS